MTPTRRGSNTILIGEAALEKLVDAIEKAYCSDVGGDFGRIQALDYLALGIKAVLTHTGADVTKETAQSVSSFRDCDYLSDFVDLLSLLHGGSLRIVFKEEKEVA